MSSLARQFLSAVVHGGKVDALFENGQIDQLFADAEKPDLEFVMAHVAKYGKTPSVEVLEQHLKEELPAVHEPPLYYLDHMRQVHVERTLRKTIKDVSQKFIDQSAKPLDVLEQLRSITENLVGVVANQQVFDLRYANDLLQKEYARVVTGDMTGRVLTGWKSLDMATAGMAKGDLVSIIGRPAAGKSWSALKIAMHHYMTDQAAVPLVVSMEMDALTTLQRSACLLSGVSYHALIHGNLTSYSKKLFDEAMGKLKSSTRPYLVVDGNLTATVDDIVALALRYQPTMILIDGGYLLRHSKEMDLYKRVSVTAEETKQRLCPLAPVVETFQFSRKADKKKKEGEEVTLADIAYSDAIGQLSSLVLGLFPEDNAEDVNVRRYNLLKGRKGEAGHFLTKWQFFPKMDFSEIVDADTAEIEI